MADHRRGRFLHALLWPVARVMFPVLVRVHGGENVPTDRRPLIVVANHQSWLDGVFLSALLFSSGRTVHWVAAQKYLSVRRCRELFAPRSSRLSSRAAAFIKQTVGAPLVACSLRFSGAFPINTDQRTIDNYPVLKAIRDHIEHGEVVGIFPEGRITDPDTPSATVGKGVEFITRLVTERSQVWVLPVALKGRVITVLPPQRAPRAGVDADALMAEIYAAHDRI